MTFGASDTAVLDLSRQPVTSLNDVAYRGADLRITQGCEAALGRHLAVRTFVAVESMSNEDIHGLFERSGPCARLTDDRGAFAPTAVALDALALKDATAKIQFLARQYVGGCRRRLFVDRNFICRPAWNRRCNAQQAKTYRM